MQLATESALVYSAPVPLQAGPEYVDAQLRIDYVRSQAWLDGRPLVTTRKEFELLAMLARHAGQIVNRETLLQTVWGYRPEVRTRTLDVHIRRLRKKLGVRRERAIETIFGIGYRFQPMNAPAPQRAVA